MKKYLLLWCIITLSIFSMACKSNNIDNEISISKAYSNEEDISVYQENEELKILIGKSRFQDITLDFFKTDISGIALFGIEREKLLMMNEELPIVGYITGDNVKNVQNTNIDDIFKEKSDNEIIIYLKIMSVE